MSKLEWIDVLKGIGIVFVVAGHIYIGDVSDYIYLFHMPLFFFIGGYLYTVKYNQKEYFIKKVYHLLVPYLSFLILLYFFPLIISVFVYPNELTTISVFKQTLKGLIGGRYLGGITGIFWFVTVFFITQQLMNYLLNKFSFKITSIIILVFLLASYINSVYYPEFWLPFNSNVVLASLPIFYIGYLEKSRYLDINKYIIVFVFILSIIFLSLGYHNTYDMKYSNYGIPLLTYISSISCIYILIYIAKRLENVNIISSVFKQLGLASMIIMYLHQPIQITMTHLGIMNETIRFFVAIIFSYVAFIIFNKYNITRKYLVGQAQHVSIVKR